MCDWVNENWAGKSALTLCSYLMWRLNWIHPFLDGNGRTSRAISYLVLCAKLGDRLPGKLTIPEQIAAHKDPYYAALEGADAAAATGELNFEEMEALLQSYLAKQLSGAFADASSVADAENEARRLH